MFEKGFPQSIHLGGSPVLPDPSATMQCFFRLGDSHKLRIHAKNCLELALKKWGRRPILDKMAAEHSLRKDWRNAPRCYSFLSWKSDPPRWITKWSRFRISPAIFYIEHWFLADFNIESVRNDWVAVEFVTSMTKFYHLLRFEKWTDFETAVAWELININLLSKEILFGLTGCSPSSLDLLMAGRNRNRYGTYDVNNELTDDILFKAYNQHSSLNQLGSEDCAQRFKDAYLETLCLGETLDYLKLEGQESLMKFPGVDAGALNFISRTMKVSYVAPLHDVTDDVSMGIPIGMSVVANNDHEDYAQKIDDGWRILQEQIKNNFPPRWNIVNETQVEAQICGQISSQLQYFAALHVAEASFVTVKQERRYRRRTMTRVNSTRKASSMVIFTETEPPMICSLLACVCAVVYLMGKN